MLAKSFATRSETMSVETHVIAVCVREEGGHDRSVVSSQSFLLALSALCSRGITFVHNCRGCSPIEVLTEGADKSGEVSQERIHQAND